MSAELADPDAGSNRRRQPLGHGDEDAVADLVPELVIGGLEAVDACEHHRETRRQGPGRQAAQGAIVTCEGRSVRGPEA